MNNQNTLVRQPDFMRLSLMERELSSMLSKLHSYKCEPCTSEMYDEYMDLNSKGKTLQHSILKTNQIMNRNSAKFSQAISEEIDKITKIYDNFQKSLSSYFMEAIAHH